MFDALKIFWAYLILNWNIFFYSIVKFTSFFSVFFFFFFNFQRFQIQSHCIVLCCINIFAIDFKFRISRHWIISTILYMDINITIFREDLIEDKFNSTNFHINSIYNVTKHTFRFLFNFPLLKLSLTHH